LWTGGRAESREITDHLSEGSYVRNVVVQIPKFDAKPNPKPNPNPSPNPNSNPNPKPIIDLALTLTRFGAAITKVRQSLP